MGLVGKYKQIFLSWVLGLVMGSNHLHFWNESQTNLTYKQARQEWNFDFIRTCKEML